MLSILAGIIVVIGVGIVLTMLIQAIRGTVEILCLRNFFLLGFIVFQITSAVLVLIYKDPGQYPLNEWAKAGTIYTTLLVLFLMLFFSIYHAGFGMDRLAAALRIPDVRPGPAGTLALSVVFLVFGGMLFGGVNVPYIGVIAIQIGAAFLAIAVGLAGWTWAPRLFNPMVAMVCSGVLLSALFLLFTSDGFGRRDMVGLGAAFGWGAYFGYWRYLGIWKVLKRFVILGGVAGVLLALVTTTRFIEGRDDLSAQQRISNLARGDVGEGLYALASGQSAAGYSMYFIETRPRSKDYDTLHSLRYFMTFPIPRSIWAGKPDALALTSVHEVSTRGKPEGWNIGPGLMGHIANDNPFIALPIYALLLAMFFRFMDSLLKYNVANPFVVIAVGVALGQVVALPRGELANFSMKMIAYMLGAMIAMQFIGRVVANFVSSDVPTDADEEWDEWAEEEVDPYADYGYDAGEPERASA